jgi:hypothetical protein
VCHPIPSKSFQYRLAPPVAADPKIICHPLWPPPL